LNNALESYLALAFALRAAPGAYAVLLGAGASISAGMPAAWDVQQQLISDLARAQGEEPEDPSGWWRVRYGSEPTYDGVLGTLTHTSAERQGLLRPYFEPSDEDREASSRLPSPAHRAVADLVSGGYIRVVLTTNFDFLIEGALREVGVEPVVASSPDAIVGLSPLHLLAPGQCVVVHLHGDYLSDRLLNTADELGAYPPETDHLLDRLLDEYGLIIAGWSAKWDVALRKAVLRAPGRRFATYWVDPVAPSGAGAQVASHRSAVIVTETADSFLPRVSDACRSLAETRRKHPLTITAAVATAKRELAGGRVAIPLHDALRAEAEKVGRSTVVHPDTWQATDHAAEFQDRRAQIEAECEVLAALVATAAYWGSPSTDRWWLDLLEALTARPHVSGSLALINLARAPGLIIAYAAGVAACGAGRDDLVAALLTRPHTDDTRGIRGRLLEVLDTSDVLDGTQAGKRLHGYLRPIVAEHLGRGAAYADDWDRWQLLVTVAMMDARRSNRPIGAVSIPYLRVTGSLHEYRCLAGERLRGEVANSDHPLLAAGLCDHDPDRFQAALTDVDTMTGSSVYSTLSARMVGRVVQLPSEPFYSY
jgi:hypothetical protein